MGLASFGEQELRRAGLFDEDSDYNGGLGKSVLELLTVFAKQGHSGGSALRTLELFNRLAHFKPLTSITSNPEEWNEIGEGTWQSRRDPSFFSADGGKTFWCIDPPRGFWKKLRWRLTDRRRWKKNIRTLRKAPWQNPTH